MGLVTDDLTSLLTEPKEETRGEPFWGRHLFRHTNNDAIRLASRRVPISEMAEDHSHGSRRTRGRPHALRSVSVSFASRVF